MSEKTKESAVTIDPAETVTGDRVIMDRLLKGGLNQWPIMEQGGLGEGVDYEYQVTKIISFTSQPQKKDKSRYYNYATVMCDEGTTLCLPINQGLIETYYSPYLGDDLEILDDVTCNFRVEYNVKIFETDGKPVMDETNRKYRKKDVSKIKYIA